MLSVDVIIPVYRPDEKLNRLLAALKTQTVKPERIILVHTGEVSEDEPDYRADVGIRCDGSAGDALAKLTAAMTDRPAEEDRGREKKRSSETEWILCIIPGEAFDHGGSRNLGAALSKADVMVFMTQDAVPADERLLEKLVSALSGEVRGGAPSNGNGVAGGALYSGMPDCAKNAAGNAGAVAAAYARQLPYDDCKAVERYIREFNYPAESELRTKTDLPVRGIKTFCNSNVCSAYRREVFDRLGGFEEKTIFNEDMLFGAKAVLNGYGIKYEAEAKVYHSHNLSLADQFHRNFDNAVSQTEHRSVFAAVSSEKEGMKLVKYCISRMKEDGKLYLVPYFVLNCACRYAGFFLGKKFQKLPGWLVKACSLNKGYWKSSAGTVGRK